MNKTEKEAIVAELAERLRATESLIVADYRGLTNSQLVDLRASLRGSGAKLRVVKNTLTRRAAEEAGAESLLALLEGPTAIAFVESEGDPAAVAKALSEVAKETKVLSLRGGVLSGRSFSGDELEELAKLPPIDVVKSQLVGVIIAPLTQLLGLLEAPVRDLVGLIDARIAQLEEGGDAASEEPSEASAEPVEQDAAVEETTDGPAAAEPAAEAASDEEVADTTDEPQAAAEPEVEAPADEAADDEQDDPTE